MSGNRDRAVIRGGGWNNNAMYTSSIYRGNEDTGDEYNNDGFRLARNIPKPLTEKVVRGGGWYIDEYLRKEFRYNIKPDNWTSICGFRLVRNIVNVFCVSKKRNCIRSIKMR
jgi:formylglycine-generating enzyme required for sulfatase activity